VRDENTKIPVDPLRKRPTTFNRSSKEVVVDNTMWTETPAQKQQRLADEAAGVKRHKDPVRGEKDLSLESKGKRQRDEELKAQVERHSVCLVFEVAEEAALINRNHQEENHYSINTKRKEQLRRTRGVFGTTSEIWV
jgi:hypothetical protein